MCVCLKYVKKSMMVKTGIKSKSIELEIKSKFILQRDDCY